MPAQVVADPGRLGSKFAAALFAVALIALSVVAGTLYNGYTDPETYKNLGQWGDFVGGTLNPILTFCTFVAILVTIALQKIELGLTRQELTRSANALEAQGRAIEKQNFEATFFQMLNLHNTIVNSMDLARDGEIIEGRDCFRAFYTRLNKIYRANQKKAGAKHTDEKVLALSYKIFWKESQLDLGHYYRYLFNIIRFVKNSGHSYGPYIKLLRAQLSDQELLLLFYNCLSPQGEKFKAYGEEFALFDNMPIIRLLDPKHQYRLQPQAYGAA